MNRRERRSAGSSAKQGVADNNPSSPARLRQMGWEHFQAGRHSEAQACGRQALAIDPEEPDALHLMGSLALHASEHAQAIQWFSRAIGRLPKAEYVFSLGIALHRAGRLEDGVKAFDKAVQLKPDDAEAWHHLANVLFELKRVDVALLAYLHVLKLDPHHGDAAYRCGSIFSQQGQFEQALPYFDLCDTIQSNHPVVLEQRGLALFELKRFEEAQRDFRRAHKVKPDSPDLSVNIGASLQSLDRHEDALPWFDKAVAARPTMTIALMNKALSLIKLGRLDEAASVFRHIKTIEPDHAEAEWNLSLLNLLAGNFEAGWAGREARWKTRMRSTSYPEFSKPKWLGDTAVEGKTILVVEDEGLGDTIQFSRYVPMLAARGANVVLIVKDALHPLLSNLPGLGSCIPKSATSLPEFDMHCPICSLPLAFQTRLDTIPPVAPLTPDESRRTVWESRLGARRKPRIGLVWSGNPQHDNDHNRSIPFQTLARILDLEATFVSLQKDVRASDMAAVEQYGIVDFTSGLTDFSETAALISCLDLVITVDTSVAHLAGTLGCPTWILLPVIPDFRWLLDRDDSPWYPSVRLFRQSSNRDWGEVLERVRHGLQQQIQSSS